VLPLVAWVAKCNEEKVKDTEKDTPEKGRGTIDELMDYAIELGLPEEDGAYMFDHWSANGWKNGTAPSRDWKAGMRKWKQSGWLPSQKTNGVSQTQKKKTVREDTML